LVKSFSTANFPKTNGVSIIPIFGSNVTNKNVTNKNVTNKNVTNKNVS
jgi:hypothetical protein